MSDVRNRVAVLLRDTQALLSEVDVDVDSDYNNNYLVDQLSDAVDCLNEALEFVLEG